MAYGQAPFSFPQPRPMPQQGMAQPFQGGFGGAAQGFPAHPQTGMGQPNLGGLGGWASSIGRGNQDPLARAQAAGLYNPLGSPLLRAALQRQAMRTADAQRRRGSVLSQLVGLSPEQQRVAMLDTERQASGNTADFLNNVQLQQLQGNQDYGRSLFGGQLDFERQQRLLQQQAQIAKSQRPGAGAMLGQLAGTTIGAVVPGASRFFGGAGGAGGGGGGYQYLNPNMPYGGGY